MYEILIPILSFIPWEYSSTASIDSEFLNHEFYSLTSQEN